MDQTTGSRPNLRLRTVFISDVHLGFKGCRAEFLLDFLRRVECEHIYLVGDIVDVWRLTRWFYWPQAHNDVVRTILGKAKHGTHVVYVPGNHDEAVPRPRLPAHLRRRASRGRGDPRDGRRPQLLVMHGDQFDGIVRASPLARDPRRLGLCRGAAPQPLRQLRSPQARLPYWSLSAFLKHKVKNAVQFIANFEHAVAVEARRRGVDGVVCGHIHHAEIAQDRRRPLLQRRRLGRELHRAGRGFRRPPAASCAGPRRRGARRRRRRCRCSTVAAGRGVSRLRIAIVTDAWRPQINGVVRTLATRSRASCAPRATRSRSSARRTSAPCPARPIPRSGCRCLPAARLRRHAEAVRPRCDHISSPRDRSAGRRAASAARRGIPFTTAYHTRFPEYVRARISVPLSWSYAFVRWFHGRASPARWSSSPSMPRRARGARLPEPRAVVARRRHHRCSGRARKDFLDLPRPIWLYVGRVAIEKNIEAFLDLDLPGTKSVVGDGPQRSRCSAAIRRHVFARLPRTARISLRTWQRLFVFPSRTDTFGLVMVEAMASGVPVAAYPVPGPLDVVARRCHRRIERGPAPAALAALRLDPAACRAHALAHSWEASTRQFLTRCAADACRRAAVSARLQHPDGIVRGLDRPFKQQRPSPMNKTLAAAVAALLHQLRAGCARRPGAPNSTSRCSTCRASAPMPRRAAPVRRSCRRSQDPARVRDQLDVPSATVTAIAPLGLKDHSIAGQRPRCERP